MENFEKNDKTELYFDRAYPDRMREMMVKIVEKYSGNKQMSNPGDAGKYLFTPDAPSDIYVNEPYMDYLGLDRGQYIGVNTTKLYLSQSYNWSKTKISPKAKISEIIIETPNIPTNFFDIPFTPDWIKIKFLKLNDFSVFQNIKTNSYAFDKCKFNGNLLDQIKEYNPNLKLQLVKLKI
jgi:hypothetical protein